MPYIMILNNLKQFLKNRFFTKNAIFCNFLDFLIWYQNIDFSLKIHENWLEILPKASPSPQTHPKYIGWYYIMIWGRLKKSQKSIIFRTIPLFRPRRGIVRKMIDLRRFLRFFQSSSNHYIILSNLFGVCLGTQRGFRKHF